MKLAITQLAEDRANLGANIARLNYTNEQLGVLRDNLSAANSRIKDVDVADEILNSPVTTSSSRQHGDVLAQANATPQSALRLQL